MESPLPPLTRRDLNSSNIAAADLINPPAMPEPPPLSDVSQGENKFGPERFPWDKTPDLFESDYDSLDDFWTTC